LIVLVCNLQSSVKVIFEIFQICVRHISNFAEHCRLFPDTLEARCFFLKAFFYRGESLHSSDSGRGGTYRNRRKRLLKNRRFLAPVLQLRLAGHALEEIL